MEVVSYAILAQTGSPKRPTSSLSNNSLSSRSALALSSSRAAAYMSAFSYASFLARRTKDCSSSTSSYQSNMFNRRFRCLRRVINASSVLLYVLSSSKAFNSSQGFEYDRLAEKQEKHRGMKNTADVRLTRTEPEHN